LVSTISTTLLDPKEIKLKPREINKFVIGDLKVRYFKILTKDKQAPLIVKLAEEEIPIFQSRISVYISFNKDFPDAEDNEGEYSCGKIRVMPPKGSGIFKTEYCSFAVLSQSESYLSIAYYFNNEQPITLGLEREYTLDRMVTQIAKTHEFQKTEFKYLRMVDKLRLMVNQCAEDSHKFKRLEENLSM
jgi:hypothetical protein